MAEGGWSGSGGRSHGAFAVGALGYGVRAEAAGREGGGGVGMGACGVGERALAAGWLVGYMRVRRPNFWRLEH